MRPNPNHVKVVTDHLENCKDCKAKGMFGICDKMSDLILQSALEAAKADALMPMTAERVNEFFHRLSKAAVADDPIEAHRRGREMHEKMDQMLRDYDKYADKYAAPDAACPQFIKEYAKARTPRRQLETRADGQYFVDHQLAIEFQVCGGSRLRFKDISDEVYRKYMRYDATNGPEPALRIENPVAVAVSDNGHRIVDQTGKAFYIDHASYQYIEWCNRVGAPRVNF